MDRAELQAIQLAAALGLGLGLGFFYDVYRVWFRRLAFAWIWGCSVL
ncbi:MAG: hypothetical protein OSJ64_01330 [Firmicutes bacterium]|nr:hypothetical protein [Bacillota bacterium]